MNRTRIISALGALILGSASGQTLAPEVAPLAAKYEADIKSLDAARTAAVSRVKQDYLSDLDAAEKTATASGKVGEVSAILKVRAAIGAGSVETAPPSGMSKAQEKRHADYFSALAAVDREFAPRYEAKTADYLRNLAMVASRVPATSPVRQQIDELKAKLTATAASGGSRQLSSKTFDNTEWLWDGWPERVWKFLPEGKIVTDTGDRQFGWRIIGTDGVMITARGKDFWKLTMNFDTMEAKGLHVSNPKDSKRIVFKGKASK